MQAKIAIPGLLKRKVSWNKVYDVIIFVHDVTSKILSRDSSYVVNVVMWVKFGNSSISTRYSQFYKDLTKNTAFFEGWSWFMFNNLGLKLGHNFYPRVSKGLKGFFPQNKPLLPSKFEGLNLS